MRLVRGSVLFSRNGLQLLMLVDGTELMVRGGDVLLSRCIEMFSLHSCLKRMKRLRPRETDGAYSIARLAKLRLILIA